MKEITQNDIDPELNDHEDHGVGDPGSYDGEAVDYIAYDHSQFEVDDDFDAGVDEDE